MPELHFKIEAAEAVPHAAAPLIALKLRITNLPASEAIHTLTLRCQVQIEPSKRRYVPQEQEKLLDLFGTPERWSRTVRPLLWMNATVAVPGFTDNVLVDLQLPCTFDFNVAATKYFHALETGEIPVCVMFSGTVFYQGEDGSLQVAQVPWDREANLQATDLHVERDDGDALSKYIVALLAAGRVRTALPVQGASRYSDVGAGHKPGAGSRSE